MKYINVVDACHDAQNLIDKYCSDAHVEIIRHNFPYVVLFDWVFPFKGMGFPTKSTQLQFQSQVTFYICNIILFLQADTKQYRDV